MPQEQKTTSEQQAEIAKRYSEGETQETLAKEFGVNVNTIRSYCRKLKAVRVVPPPARDLNEFAKRVRSVLWNQDHGKDKKTYDAWQARVDSLEGEAGYTKNQAIVQASKDYPCLTRLFREYDLAEFDPNPESHPTLQCFGKQPVAGVAANVPECEGKEQSYRDNLRWAIETAGSYVRTGQAPATCPNDAAYYLYRQAIEEPKDFLAKVGQIESKGDSESEEKRSLRKSGQKSVAELDAMLAELEGE